MHIKFQDLLSFFNKSNFPLFKCDVDFNVIEINDYMKNSEIEIKIADNLANYSLENFEVLKLVLENLEQEYPFTCNNFLLKVKTTSITFYPIIDNQNKLAGIMCSINPNKALYQESHKDIPCEMYQNFQVPNMRIMNLLSTIAHKLEQFEQYDELDAVNEIAKNCYCMLKSSTVMTQYHKLENKQVEFKNKKHILNNYLEDLLKSLQVLLAGSGYSLSYKICPEKLLCDFDDEYLSMALFQIISNSCIFSPKDSVISVTLASNNGSANISISDEGAGIKKDDKQRIFDPFFSNNSTGFQSVDNHTGLGLPMAKLIIEGMNGNIIVKSEENQGTTIGIKLPKADTDDIDLNLKTNTQKYFTNRFSAMYIFFSDVCNISFF